MWTPLIGLLTVVVHYSVCVFVQRDTCPWYVCVLMAYTVGAVCKMYQFAVNHDICHGTAGAWLENNDTLKRCAMQLLTLPSLGGTMHSYYEFQHIGHHASLGAVTFEDIAGNDKDENKYSLDGLRKFAFFPGIS